MVVDKSPVGPEPASKFCIEPLTWQAEVKEAKDSEREARRGIARCCAIISRVLLSPQSAVLLAVVVWNVSQDLSTRRLVESLRFSLRTLSVMPSLIPSTLKGRPSPLWMSSMLWRDKDVPYTVSEVKFNKVKQNLNSRTLLGPPKVSKSKLNNLMRSN